MDHQNKFHELESKIFDLKKLEGPIYSVERKHHYNEIDQKMEQLKTMNYPIREGVEGKKTSGAKWVIFSTIDSEIVFSH